MRIGDRIDIGACDRCARYLHTFDACCFVFTVPDTGGWKFYLPGVFHDRCGRQMLAEANMAVACLPEIAAGLAALTGAADDV